MAEPDPQRTQPAPEPAFEEVLVEALDVLEREGAPGVERILRANPGHAARLRSHLSRLHGLGLLADSDSANGSGDGGGSQRAFPERLGDFRLLQRLGGGGMGVVFRAEQVSLGRTVALKLVRSEHLFFPGAKERFRREVDAIARLQHPAIVPVHAAGEDAGVPWLAMELVDGASLDAVLQQLGGRDPAQLRGRDLRQALHGAMGRAVDAATATPTSDTAAALFEGTWVSACLRIVRTIALALQHAHDRGVLHRDVKPSNVMLTLDGRVLLLDFGLALADGGARLTGSGAHLGTPAYMSPEQMRGANREIDGRTDVYSLGITLFELLTLHMPFAADSTAATRELVLAGKLPPLRERNRAVTRDAEVVVRKACDAEAARRYASAAAFADDLGNLLELRPIQAQPPGPLLLARRWAQRRPAAAIALVAGMLLFLVAPTVFLLQQQAANREIQAALDDARNQKRQAETARDTAREQERLASERGELVKKQRDLAIQVVRDLLTRVAEEERLDDPRLVLFRRELLDKARDYFERFLAHETDDPDLLQNTARAALDLVFAEGELGRIDVAGGQAARSVELARRFCRHPGSGIAGELLLAEAVMTFGRIQLMQAHYDEARQLLVEGHRLVDAMLQREPQNVAANGLRLGMLRGDGILASSTGDLDGAHAAFAAVADAWTQRLDGLLTAPDERSVALDHVVCSLADHARLYAEHGQLAVAEEVAERMRTIVRDEEAIELPTTVRIAAARIEIVMAAVAAAEGQEDRQEQCLRECLRICDQVFERTPEHANAMRAMAMATNSLGLLYDRRGRDQEAMQFLEQSLALTRRIVAVSTSVHDAQVSLASTIVNVGSLHKQAGRPAMALPLLVEGERIARTQLEKVPNSKTAELTLFNALWFLGQVGGDLRDAGLQADAGRRLAELRPQDGRALRIAGALYSEAIGLLANDTTVAAADKEQRRAAWERAGMDLLRAAAQHGCIDLEYLEVHDHLRALRALPGYDAVLRQVAANVDAAERDDR